MPEIQIRCSYLSTPVTPTAPPWQRNVGMVFQSYAVSVPIGESPTAASHIVFRPQNMTIQSSDVESLPGMMRLVSTVDHMEFLGSVVRYRVAVGEHFLLVDASYQRSEVPIAEGTPVTLSLNREQIITLDN